MNSSQSINVFLVKTWASPATWIYRTEVCSKLHLFTPSNNEEICHKILVFNRGIAYNSTGTKVMRHFRSVLTFSIPNFPIVFKFEPIHAFRRKKYSCLVPLKLAPDLILL